MVRATRRDIVKSTGLAIVTLGGTGPAIAGSTKTENTVKLPKLVSNGEPVEYMRVPKKWNEHRVRAKEILNHQRESFAKMVGITGTGLSSSQKTYGGKRGLQITVDVNKEFTDTDKIPSEIDRIPINISHRPPGKPAACNVTYNCQSYDGDLYLMGGEQLNGGSSCCRVTDGSENYMLTVGHLWYDEDNEPCVSDSWLESQTAEIQGTDIGDVLHANADLDYAIIEESSNVHFDITIDENHSFPDCVGYVPEATLDSWASAPNFLKPCLYQMGMTTGRTQGRLDQSNYWDAYNPCVDFIENGKQHGVSTYCDFGVGDSGGPTYHIQDGDAYLVCPTALYYYAFGSSCGNDVGNDSAGVAAFKIFRDDHPQMTIG